MNAQQINLNLNFLRPFRLFIVGDSGVGKTQLAKNVLLFEHKQEPFCFIILIYQFYQPIYDELRKRFGKRLVLCERLSDVDLEDLHDQAGDRSNLLMFDEFVCNLLFCI